MASPEKSAEPGVPGGFRAAVVFGFLGLGAALLNPLTGLVWSAIFFSVAWGIRRRQVWAAIAGTCFLLVPIAALALHFRTLENTILLIVTLFIQAAMSVFFLRAASSLWSERSNHTFAPWILLIAIHVAVAFCLRAYSVPTESMQNTLLLGDQILVDDASWFLGRAPRHGDIVVFRYPADRSKLFIKRVVGLPGDRLRMHDRKLYRNGSEVIENYAVYASGRLDPRRDFPPISASLYQSPTESLLQKMLEGNQQNGEIVVPKGKVFVLGDNRDDSLDSRYFGFVNRVDIIGSPVIIFGSYEIDMNTDPEMTKSVLNFRWTRILKLF